MIDFAATAVRQLAALLVLAAAVTGCAVTKVLPDNEPSALPAFQEAKAKLGLCEDVKMGPIPATVRHLDRPVRYLSLTEAIAIALENGYTGANSARSPGFANDDLLT